jgi:antitoxin HigA-1
MSDGFWSGLQLDYDLANVYDQHAAALARIERYDVHAA